MNLDNIESPALEVLAPDATASVERAQIDCQIATAKRYPRNISKVKSNIQSFACLDEDTAAGCFYTVPRGGKSVQGPSVRLAEIVVSCYGNLRVQTQLVSADTTSEQPSVTVRSTCHDLENNVAVSIEKRRQIHRKTDYKTKEKKAVTEDDITLAFNSGAAIAFRDAVFKVVPGVLVKPAWLAAQDVAVGTQKTLVERRGLMVARLAKMGIPLERVLSAVNLKSVDDIGLDELGELFGLFTGVKEGTIDIDTAFPASVNGKGFNAGPQPLADDAVPIKQEAATEAKATTAKREFKLEAKAPPVNEVKPPGHPKRDEFAAWMDANAITFNQLMDLYELVESVDGLESVSEVWFITELQAAALLALKSQIIAAVKGGSK